MRTFLSMVHKKKLTKRIVACDPGKNGGIVLLSPSNHTVYYSAMPADLNNVIKFFNIVDKPKRAVYWYEYLTFAQQARGKDGEVLRFSNPRAMGVLGRNSGHIEGIARAKGFDVKSVIPQQWMNAIGAHNAGISYLDKTAWKNNLKSIAIEEFPNAKVTLKIADALLIALYAYRVEMNDTSASLRDWACVKVLFD